MNPKLQQTEAGTFWSELRRRGVVRAGGVYVAAAFVVLQLGEIVLPAFNAPDWVLQSLVIFVFLGLPVALAFSWVYDLTAEGLTRTGALVRRGRGTVVPQLALVGVTAVSGALGVLWFGTNALTTPDGGGSAVAPAPGVASFANLDPNAPITAVAVLPLADFAEDNDFFARQLHEEIITQLSILTTLRVVSRTSVERYATTDKLLPEIAAELRVQAVVTGSVAMTAESDSVRISVQLLHAPSDTHLLSRTFQREMKDILRLQTEVAVEIAGAVQGELGADVTEDIEQIAEVDPEAHRAFLMGREELERGTTGGLEAALEHSDRAVTIDSTFAPAWAQWAGARLVMAHEGGELSPDDLARVEEALRRATRVRRRRGRGQRRYGAVGGLPAVSGHDRQRGACSCTGGRLHQAALGMGVHPDRKAFPAALPQPGRRPVDGGRPVRQCRRRVRWDRRGRTACRAGLVRSRGVPLAAG